MAESRPLAAGTTTDELRRAFDRTFAEPLRERVEAFEDLLAIRVAGDPYVLRLAEVSGLFADRLVTPLPTPVAPLLGVAGVRGALVPIYDLGALLGYGVGGPRRWTVSLAQAPVGVAFETFEAHLRIPLDAIASDEAGARVHVRQVARTREGVRPVLNLPSVLDEIKRLADLGHRPKEQ